MAADADPAARPLVARLPERNPLPVLHPLAPPRKARDAAVADLARRYFDVMLSYPQLRYVMAWGLVDKYSWLQGRWPRADGLAKRPNPYDDDYRPKPLREAIAAAFRAAPPRPQWSPP